MRTVKGEYKNGVIKLLEEVPEIMSKKVLITFLEEEDNEQELIRTISLQQPNQFFQQYISNKKKGLYQEFSKKDNDRKHFLSKQLRKESKLTRNESMKVLKEFEEIDD